MRPGMLALRLQREQRQLQRRWDGLDKLGVPGLADLLEVTAMLLKLRDQEMRLLRIGLYAPLHRPKRARVTLPDIELPAAMVSGGDTPAGKGE